MRKFEWKFESGNMLLPEYQLYANDEKSDIRLLAEEFKEIKEKFGEVIQNLRAKLTSHDITDREQNRCISAFIKCWYRTRDKAANILIPLIRKIIPGMIANDIVGVQPMTGPAGAIFSIRHKYTNNTAPQGATP